MKIRSVPKDIEEVRGLPVPAHKKPMKPSLFFRTVMKIASLPDLWSTHFRVKRIGIENLKKNEPCLILMNHSSFIDLEIAASVLYPRPFSIVTTTDAFIGKNLLMRLIGCIPTQKFVADPTLIRDMQYAVKNNKCSIVMFPEAGYTLDGTGALLPDSLGYCIKKLGIPLLMIRTYGAFTRDPLYNNLQRRKVRVSAELSYLLSPEEISGKSSAELNQLVREQFSFDNFRWQQENGITVKEAFRADGLNRILYKCPHCQSEGKMRGEGIRLSCPECGKVYILEESGYLKAEDGITEFTHIPDWVNWQRECVRSEIESGNYSLSVPVDIHMLVNTRCLYNVGQGTLVHDSTGFTLTGCDGKLSYTQKPASAYTLNSDFYWYERGDVISIGTYDALYYCFPQTEGDIVFKTKLAAEEIYKMNAPRRTRITRGETKNTENP